MSIVGWKRRAVAAALTAGLLAIGACTHQSAPKDEFASPSAPTTTAPALAGIGADGIGDPYFPKDGNGGYDVASYALDLKYTPTSGELAGTATIQAVATANLTRFNLDLRKLAVSAATVDQLPAKVVANGDELEVTPAKALTAGATFVTTITYSGVPSPYNDPELGDVGFLRTDDGAVAIGEPDVAASWFPANDHPRDKATYTIKITVPSALSAIANGVMTAKTQSAGWTSWTWTESKPMATYLASLVIGRYRITESTYHGLPILLAVDASLPAEDDARLGHTAKVLDFLVGQFGPYPFDAAGGIIVADPRIRFALENQSRPVYGKGFFGSPGDTDWVLVHELAHQWFGDSVSVNSWSDIWLNEGFATYAEWLWREHIGAQSAQSSFDLEYKRTSSQVWQIPPGAPGAANIFSESVYNRGAMAVHALRVAVGDTVFFKIIREWVKQKAYGNGSTEQFIALAKQLSGKDLDPIFKAWLFKIGQPPRG